MVLPGLSIVFTYFDSFIGPKSFYVYPDMDLEILELLSSFLGLHQTDVVFNHTYKDFRFFSQNFQIDAPKARSAKITCLMSVCCNINYQNIMIPSEMLNNLTRKIQKLNHLDLLLTRHDAKIDQLEEANSKFKELMKLFYDELISFIEQGKTKLTLYIPGLFTFKNEIKIGARTIWNHSEFEPNYCLYYL